MFWRVEAAIHCLNRLARQARADAAAGAPFAAATHDRIEGDDDDDNDDDDHDDDASAPRYTRTYRVWPRASDVSRHALVNGSVLKGAIAEVHAAQTAAQREAIVAAGVEGWARVGHGQWFDAHWTYWWAAVFGANAHNAFGRRSSRRAAIQCVSLDGVAVEFTYCAPQSTRIFGASAAPPRIEPLEAPPPWAIAPQPQGHLDRDAAMGDHRYLRWLLWRGFESRGVPVPHVNVPPMLRPGVADRNAYFVRYCDPGQRDVVTWVGDDDNDVGHLSAKLFHDWRGSRARTAKGRHWLGANAEAKQHRATRVEELGGTYADARAAVEHELSPSAAASVAEGAKRRWRRKKFDSYVAKQRAVAKMAQRLTADPQGRQRTAVIVIGDGGVVGGQLGFGVKRTWRAPIRMLIDELRMRR